MATDPAVADERQRPQAERQRHQTERQRPLPDNWRSTLFQVLIVVPITVYLIATLPTYRDDILQTSVILFIVTVAVVDLIPVPAWGGMQLSLSFPILLGVAIIYPPPVAALIAFLGSFDPRELRLQMPPLRAAFNRAQMSFSILVGGTLFHLVGSMWSPAGRLVLGVVLATVAAYLVNVVCVATHQALLVGIPLPRVLRKMHGVAPYEFLLSYIGLGLLGAVIARFYLNEGYWSVVAFLAPLVFARQMYFRSRALADRLAEQNALLAEQAQRLEQLLAKEHHTVDELRELNRMKGEFVAVVSHELRTPVTALIGYAKTLRQPEFADDPLMREEFLERMERQSDRLLRLVENLLTASRIESQQLPLSIGRVLFEDLVHEVTESLAGNADRVRVHVPQDLPVLYTDRQLLSQVLQNLVDNALKYSPDGSPCELEARPAGDAIVFWVQDHGIGISEEEMARIFERFYQVDQSSTRTFRGAGLGLSLVQDLLRHLGGTIEVGSAPGEGSRFTVTIPVRHPNLEQVAPRVAQELSADA
jgi:signal transduction histidine kinase